MLHWPVDSLGHPLAPAASLLSPLMTHAALQPSSWGAEHSCRRSWLKQPSLAGRGTALVQTVGKGRRLQCCDTCGMLLAWLSLICMWLQHLLGTGTMTATKGQDSDKSTSCRGIFSFSSPSLHPSSLPPLFKCIQKLLPKCSKFRDEQCSQHFCFVKGNRGIHNSKGLLSPSPFSLPSFAPGLQTLKKSARSCLGVLHSMSNCSDLIWVLQHRPRRCRALGEIMGVRRPECLINLLDKSQALQMKALGREEMIFPQVSGTFQQFRNNTNVCDVLPPPNSALQHRLQHQPWTWF